MADTWEVGLEKLSINNVGNFIEMMGMDKPSFLKGKGIKDKLLKSVHAGLTTAFVEEASDNNGTNDDNDDEKTKIQAKDDNDDDPI